MCIKRKIKRLPVLLLPAACLGACLFLAACSNSPTDAQSSEPGSVVRLDGIYYCALDSNSAVVPADTQLNEYLRFGNNGVVYKNQSSGTPEEVAEWIGAFRNTAYPFSHSPYFEQGNTVEFASFSHYGRIDYKGTVSSDKIVFKQHNYITEIENTVTFNFKKVNFAYQPMPWAALE